MALANRRSYAFVVLAVATVLVLRREQQVTQQFLQIKASQRIVSIHERNEVNVPMAFPPMAFPFPTAAFTTPEDARQTNRQTNEVAKLFPLHLPIPPSFLRDIPVAPLLGACRVEFVPDFHMSLCTAHSNNVFSNSIGLDAAVRLLEYRFECSAQHLRKQQQQQKQKNTHCLWVPPMDSSTEKTNGDILWDGTNSTTIKTWSIDNVLFLLPFLYTDFYPLVKYRRYTPGSHCILGEHPMPPIPYRKGKDAKQHELHRISLKQPWKAVFQQARFCDFIASDTIQGLIVGDSMGIPVLGLMDKTNKSHNQTTTTITTIHNNRMSKQYPVGHDIFNDDMYSQPRSHMFPPPLERHDVDAAQRIVETFPFSFFTTIPTTIHNSSTTQSQDNLSNSTSRNTRDGSHLTTNRTLVILLGSLRGGESTWHSMYRHLLDVNHADLALMVGKYKDSMNTTTAPTSLSPYQRAKYIWEFEEYDDWADAIDLVNGTEWRHSMKEYVSKPSGILGGIKDYPGSGAIIFMARYWLIQHLSKVTENYDRFVLTRADQYYKCPQPLHDLDLRYLWVPGPNSEDYGGITDRHWVMNKHHLEKALGIMKNLIHHWERMFTGRIGHNPEALIKASWTMDSLFPHQIRRYARTHYTAYVDGDTSRWHNQKNKWGLSEDGVNIKYMDEYKLASCVCDTGHLYDHEHNLSYGQFTDAYQDWTCQNTSLVS